MSEGLEVFNASGHPIAQEGVQVADEYRIPNVDTSDPEAIRELAIDIAGRARPYVKLGIPVALPGMSILVAHVLAAIHGMTGFWPRVVWAVQEEGRFIWNAENSVDLHWLRTSMREYR